MRFLFILPTLVFLSLSLTSRPASAISITYNGACVYGNCSNPTGPPDNHNFSYDTTFSNGDVYNVAGNVQDAQYQANGFFQETFKLSYVGNASSPSSVGNDVVNFDVKDTFTWNFAGFDIADGQQNADAQFSSGFNSNGYVKGQYSIEYMAVAPFSPISFQPPISFIGESRPVFYVTGASGFPPAVWDENLNTLFGVGTLPGTSVNVSGSLFVTPAPEPGEFSLCLAGIVALAAWKRGLSAAEHTKKL